MGDIVSIAEITLIGDYATGCTVIIAAAWVFTSLMRTYFGRRK